MALRGACLPGNSQKLVGFFRPKEHLSLFFHAIEKESRVNAVITLKHGVLGLCPCKVLTWARHILVHSIFALFPYSFDRILDILENSACQTLSHLKADRFSLSLAT